MTFRVYSFLLHPKAEVKEVRKIVNKFYVNKETFEYATSATEQPSGEGHDEEELLVSGQEDDTGKIIVDYEV